MAGQDADPGACAQGSVFQPLEADDPVQLGDYVLAARLGAGGMGAVYLSHTLAGRPVAIKAIRPELAGDPDFRRRFRQEVAAARRVHGLYTAPVIDSEIDTAPLWLATAFVEGPTLAAAVTRHGTLPVASVLLLAAGVAEALQAVHGEGIVHRDLKASNVLLATDGPRVIDFGIARAVDATAVTKTGVAVGTPPFMSPEQALNKGIGPATDIFSLGQLVTYAAKGTPAFGEGQSHGVLYRIVHEEPDLADVPEALLPLLRRCLAKDPAERPSAAEVIGLCRAASEGGVLRRTGGWLPAAVTADITRHHDVPAQRSATDRPADRPEKSEAAEPTHPATAPDVPKDAGAPAPAHAATEPAEPPKPLSAAGRPPRNPTRRRALLALGATVLAGAGGTAAIIGLREEPKKITVASAATLRIADGAEGVAFSDDRTLITVSDTGKIRLWDVATGEPRTSPKSAEPAYSVALSPDGGTLATGGSDDGVVLWNVAEREVADTISTGHDSGVWAVAFSPDGKILATGSEDAKVRLWNVATRERIATLTGHEAEVRTVAFSPDGRTLASGGSDEAVRLWDITTRETTDTLSGHGSWVQAVAFSPDGRTLATAADDNKARLWDFATRKRTATLSGHKNGVVRLAFSPDGETLATAGRDKAVRLWDVATRESAAVLTGHKEEVWAVTFSPDGRALATAADDNARLWKASGGARISAARIDRTRQSA